MISSYLKGGPLTAFKKGCKVLNEVCERGYNLSIEGRQEGFNFCQNGIYKGKGLDLEKEPSCIKLH